MAFGVIAVAIALPFLPAVGRWFGFVAPPSLFFVFLIGATLTYLAIVEITKRIFIALCPPQKARFRTIMLGEVINQGVAGRAGCS
jgi:hypothetical protein